MYCPKCGQSNEAAARFCQSCGNDLATAQPNTTAMRYAGFWRRFAALFIDVIVLGVITALLTAGRFGFFWLPGFLLPWIYEGLMLSSEMQATVGKMALGIAVTDVNGRRLSFARATGRHFAKWISAIILFIGFIMAAFTPKKQALHDMIAETLVVDKPASFV